MAKMIKTHRNICKKCMYHVGFNSVQSGIACFFYVFTNKHRGCPVGKCDKFEPIDKEKRRKLLLIDFKPGCDWNTIKEKKEE